MKQGRLAIWCVSCGRFFVADEFTGRCPRCGTTLTRMRCTRCQHEWDLKGTSLPKTCPSKRCKSPYWNRVRIR